LDASDFDNGVATFEAVFDGGTGDKEITLTANELETTIEGSDTFTVTGVVTYSLKLTCPAHVTRGVAFDLTIQGWNDTSNLKDGSYEPATSVLVTLVSADTDSLVGYPPGITVDSTGWVDGAKTISVTLSGGSGELQAAVLGAADQSVTREGTASTDVNTVQPVTLTFSTDFTWKTITIAAGTYLISYSGMAGDYYQWTLTISADRYITVSSSTPDNISEVYMDISSSSYPYGIGVKYRRTTLIGEYAFLDYIGREESEPFVVSKPETVQISQ
jgi:hypothetical protein